MTERAVDPIKLHLMSGEEIDLFPSFGSLKRASLKAENGSILKSIAILPEQLMGVLLYECLPDEGRAAMTEEEFENKLPANEATLLVVAEVSARLGNTNESGGDQGNAPTSQTPKPTGSRSGRKRK